MMEHHNVSVGASMSSLHFASQVERKLPRIVRGYEARLSDPSNDAYGTPATKAAGYVRIKVYRLVRRLRRQGGDAFDLGRDPFAMALEYLFRSRGPITRADRNQIRLISMELNFADQQNVPSKYLVGFIHQVGGRKRIQQLHKERDVTQSPADVEAPAKRRRRPGALRRRQLRRRRNNQ